MLRCQCEPAGVWPVQAGTGVPRAPQLALGRCSELVAGSTLLTNDTGSCHGWENAMPLVSINLRKGRAPEVKRAIADGEHSKSWGADGVGLGSRLTRRGWAGAETGVAGGGGCGAAGRGGVGGAG